MNTDVSAITCRKQRHKFQTVDRRLKRSSALLTRTLVYQDLHPSCVHQQPWPRPRRSSATTNSPSTSCCTYRSAVSCSPIASTKQPPTWSPAPSRSVAHCSSRRARRRFVPSATNGARAKIPRTSTPFLIPSSQSELLVLQSPATRADAASEIPSTMRKPMSWP